MAEPAEPSIPATTAQQSESIHIREVCIARASHMHIGERGFLTGFHKQAVQGPVAVTALGLDGDEQADLSVHGGPSKAVYAYPREHLPFWAWARAQALGEKHADDDSTLAVGANLLTEGVLESQLWIGDTFELPGCVLVVSEPRFPCFKFNAAMGFAKASALMVNKGFCGTYLSVASPGFIRAGDAVTLVPGPRQVPLDAAFRARARA